jgi:hypothetical protein
LRKHLTKAFQSNTTGSSSRFSISVVVISDVVLVLVVSGVVLPSSSSFIQEEEEEEEETVKVFFALFPIPLTFLHLLLLVIRNAKSSEQSSKRVKSRRRPLLGPRFRLFLEKELSSSMILLPVATKQLLRGKVAIL